MEGCSAAGVPVRTDLEEFSKMYLRYEQVQATAVAQNSAAFTIPGNATQVELQACIQDVRYTMDGVTNPTQTTGMILLVGSDPKLFLIEDLQRIRFIRGAGANGNVNAHYLAGRNV